MFGVRPIPVFRIDSPRSKPDHACAVVFGDRVMSTRCFAISSSALLSHTLHNVVASHQGSRGPPISQQ